ncbi:MAG TPA: large conductance mechanosensitive channel protein MscL [Terracidiphilus sp.]|nr:large conductance mechanosensitive channel protein MscL [Terracidiphilus sp.]
MLKGFREFVLRGNVVDLAVAVIIGAAFTSIVNSLVADVLTPLIAGTVGKPNFSYLVLHVRTGELKYGNFFNNVISFLIVACVVYFGVVMPLHWFLQRVKAKDQAPAPSPTTRKCPECLSEIPLEARRCAHCTQPVPAA